MSGRRTRLGALLALCLLGSPLAWAQNGCSVTVTGEPCSPSDTPGAGQQPCRRSRRRRLAPSCCRARPCLPPPTHAASRARPAGLRPLALPAACSVDASAVVQCEGDVPERLANGGSWDDALAAAANATALNITLDSVSLNEYSLNRALRIILNAGSSAAAVSVLMDGCSMRGAKVGRARRAGQGCYAAATLHGSLPRSGYQPGKRMEQLLLGA